MRIFLARLQLGVFPGKAIIPEVRSNPHEHIHCRRRTPKTLISPLL
jgi:hypothetical protein